MPPILARYLNKNMYVSIPALFEDGVCRPFTLLGAELHGLWLQSDQLTRRLLPEDKEGLAATSAAVFVPFAGSAAATGECAVRCCRARPNPGASEAEGRRLRCPKATAGFSPMIPIPGLERA
jgi:hypothetical protein